MKLFSLIILLFFTLKIFSAQPNSDEQTRNEDREREEQIKKLEEQGKADGIWDPKEYNAIMKKLVEGTNMEKSEAALRFGRAKEKRAVKALINLLPDSHPIVMASVAEALGMIGDKQAIHPLGKWFIKLKHTMETKFNSGYNNFIIEAIIALGKIGDKEATFYILECLQAIYRPIKEAAISTLIKLKDKRAIDKLKIAYNMEQQQNVRTKILNAINYLKNLSN